MKQTRRGFFQELKAALCILLVISLTLNCGQMAVLARGAERVFDIGVNPESVTATLDDSGLLTISGSGEIRDFTPETAPFAGENVKRLEIGPDIKAIGAYAFYGCKNLTGALSLPKELISIGDGAFSGPDGAHAPKFDFVENSFTEALRTRKKGEASPTPAVTAKASEGPVPSTAPTAANAETAAPGENSPVSEAAGTASPETTLPSLAPEATSTPAPTAEPTAAPTAAPTEETENNENRYVIETVTQQEMGENVFYPRGDKPAFTCSAENNSFRQAMLEAGYQEAEGVISAAFDCGKGSCETDTVVKELPILSGRVTLPQALPEFTPPESSDLVSYSFGGWTESMDEANLVRKPGSAFTVGGREALYFIASWPQKVLIEIKQAREGEDMVFSVPTVEGYDLTAFRWQTCELAVGEEPPEAENLLPWEDLPGETGQVYRRAIEAGDENRLFRCVVTAEKKKAFSLFSLFSAAEEEELSLAAVRGAVYAVEGQYTVTCGPGAYTAKDGSTVEPTGAGPEMALVAHGDYAVIPDCTYTAPTHADGTIVFNGWAGGDGKDYDPGQVVKLSGNLTLTAKWDVATIKYVDGTVNAGSYSSRRDGTANKPYKYFAYADKYNAGPYNDFPESGTKYTNIIVVMDNTTLGTGNNAPGTKNATITSKDPSSGTKYDCTLTLSGKVPLQGDTRFENIKFTSNKNYDLLFANGHQVIMGQGLTMTNSYNFELYGGAENSISVPGEVIVQSGNYRVVHGSCYQGNTGSADAPTRSLVEISGDADVGVVCGASWLGGNAFYGDTYVYVFGNAEAAAVVGGNRSADGGAHVTGASHVIVGGSADILEKKEVQEDADFTSTGFVAGSGADSCFTKSGGNVRGGTFVEIRENATVAANVLGGSGDGWVDKGQLTTNPDKVDNYYNLTGTVGKTNVLITGKAKVGGSVFGGGNNRSCKGETSVTIAENAVIAQNVYGGGLNGNIIKEETSGATGNCTVTISGGTVNGNVYGGGTGLDTAPSAAEASHYKQDETGLVGGSATVNITGGVVKGNVFGGSKGAANNPATGTVAQNSTVNITGGEVGSYIGDGDKALQSGTGRVFGGGEYAAVTGDSVVTINTPIVEGSHPVVGDSAYGGGSDATVGGESSVTLTDGLIGKNIYGGGFGSTSSSGSTHVVMIGGRVGRYVYGGGALGAVNGNTQVEIKGGQIDYCAFAAGEGSAADAALGRVRGTADITMSGGVITGGLYGGGNLGVVGSGDFIPTAADGKKEEYQAVKATVTMTGGQVQRVFAGGAGKGSDVKSEATPADLAGANSADSFHGAVYGSTSLTITGGVVKGNAFGGSNRAYVVGNTNVSISGNVQIDNSVYGGSNLPDGDPSAGFDSAAYLVMGNSRVTLNGAGGLTIGGGVLGSGKLTRVHGTRYLTIESYNGGLTTMQRADLVKISNSTVSVRGEDDLSDSYPGKLFSITQVRDMRLYHTDLTLASEVKELGALCNCDETLGGAEPLSPDTAISARQGISTAESARSTLQLKPGVLLQVRYTADAAAGTMAYGPVGGVFWLKMSEPAAEGMGVRIEASYDSDTGAGSGGATGAFLAAPEETNELAAGKISTIHSRWRLGGKTLEKPTTLTAALTEGGAENTVVSDWIDLPTSADRTVYQISSVVSRGKFFLVKPTEESSGMKLPAFDESKNQNAGNTFALRLDPVGTGWSGLESSADQQGAYFLTQLPDGETAWNSGVEGVWKRGTAELQTGGAGENGQVQFSLLYNGGYDSFSGGTVEVTMKEYLIDDQNEGAELNTVRVVLTLARDKSGSSQTVKAGPGRNFNDLPEDGGAVAISAKGAVTAEFLTEYYPAAAGASNMFLHLCKEDGTAVAFPSGASVVLGDRSTEGQYQYYYCVSQGEEKLCLENFTNLGATGTGYPGPGDVTNALTERLLFAVDFSGAAAGLSQGNYYLALTHRAEQLPTEAGVARAAFSVMGGGVHDLQLTQDVNLSGGAVWALTITTQAAGEDTRYEDGACVRLTLQRADGQSVSFPELLSIRGQNQDGGELAGFSESVMRDRNDTVSFTLPRNGVSTVLLDFSNVPDSVFSNGTYTLQAAMSPQVGLQMGSDRVTTDAEATLDNLRMDRASAVKRSVYLSMENDLQRLVDVSEGPAQMSFALKCENLLEGDTLTIEILRKTNRETPHDSSYAPVENQSQWGIAPASGTAAGSLGNTLTVTVPKGQESGTYRVRTLVMSGDTALTDTEQVYNFIIK